MDERVYIEKRVDEPIDWYDRKSSWNKRMYARLRVSEVTIAAFIPFLIGYVAEIKALTIIIGLLGVAIAIIAGVLGIYRFQEIWVEYRSVCERLKSEKFTYQARSGPYVGDDRYNLFVQRIEVILSTDNERWAQMQITASKPNNITA